MTTLASGKIAEVLFENALDTYEDQTMLVDKTDVFTPDPGSMQNSNNVIWRPVQQHAPVIEGWDLSGQEQEIIEETYPAVLGDPKNDFVQQRIDNLRDSTFWERRGKQAGKQQATNLNTGIANLIKNSGSLFYRSNATSGFDFISEAQALMNERQGHHTNRCFVLNDRDNQTFGQDLASRQTIKGRPSDTWANGQIGSNVAEFDVYTGSFNPSLTGGAAISTTTTAAASFAPEGGTVDATTSAVTNVDYRSATLAVTASASYNVGDKVEIHNGGTAIQSIGLADKNATDQPMTFTVVAKPTGTSLTIFPKPIAADDGALSTTEKAYANVDTTITSGATIERINTDATNKTNLFWDRDAIEVLGGDVPMELMSQFDGKKVISETMSNGLNMYMVYDSELSGLTLRYRLFTWYGLTMKDPSRAGVAVTF
jgi:hypothetical protein